MPGFLAAVCIHRPERTGAVVLFNTGAGARPEALALDLAEAALEELPRLPDALASGRRRTGRHRADARTVVVGGVGARPLLERRPPPARARGRPRRTERVVARRPSRTIAGASSRAASCGELLRVARDDAGAPAKLYVATYPLTRAPGAFADESSGLIRAVAGRVERDRDRRVRDEKHRAARLRRLAAPERDHGHGQAARERRDLDLAESERERVDEPRQQRHGGDEEHRDLGGGRERDLRGELDLPAARHHHRAAVLGGVADDRDDHGRDEEVGEPELARRTSPASRRGSPRPAP